MSSRPQVFSTFVSYLFSQNVLALDQSVVSCVLVLSKLYQVWHGVGW